MSAAGRTTSSLVGLCALAAVLACGSGGDGAAAPDGEAHLEAARQFFEEERYDSALRRFGLAAGDTATRAVALNERGMTYAARGQLERAAADLDSAVALRPDYASALSNLAVVHLELSRWERALEELDRLARLRPDDAKVYFDRAAAHRGRGDVERALADLDRALELDPEMAPAHMTRGKIYAGRDDLRLAVRDFERAASISGSRTAYTNLGVARLELDEYERAAEIFSDLISRAPLRARYHLYRARAHRGLGRDDEARTDFRRTLELTGNPGLRQRAIEALREMDEAG